MPILSRRPRDRRAFLEIAGLSGAALATSAFRRDAPTAPRPELHLALVSDTHVPGDRVNGHRGMNPWENLRVAARRSPPPGPRASLVVATWRGSRAEWRTTRS